MPLDNARWFLTSRSTHSIRYVLTICLAEKIERHVIQESSEHLVNTALGGSLFTSPSSADLTAELFTGDLSATSLTQCCEIFASIGS